VVCPLKGLLLTLVLQDIKVFNALRRGVGFSTQIDNIALGMNVGAKGESL